MTHRPEAEELVFPFIRNPVPQRVTLDRRYVALQEVSFIQHAQDDLKRSRDSFLPVKGKAT